MFGERKLTAVIVKENLSQTRKKSNSCGAKIFRLSFIFFCT